MTEFIRNWIMGIVCAAMILSIFECLSPAGSVKRVCRLAGGLILLYAAVKPMIGLDRLDFDSFPDEYSWEVQSHQNELEDSQRILFESIIEENTAAYILDKAEELDMSCSVSVTVVWDTEGLPRAHSVCVRGAWSGSQKEALSGIIESDLGIPHTMQYFKESEP